MVPALQMSFVIVNEESLSFGELVEEIETI